MQNSIRSPWIDQLHRQRPVITLDGDRSTQIAIIGGGIAGLSTAYFTLRETKKNVLLIEAGKIAHGATGHNAGQLVSYFEKQLSEIVQEFGLDLAAKAQADIDSAWQLLEEMYRDANLQTPFHQFTGYAGCTGIEQLRVHLKNARYSHEANINREKVMVAEEWRDASNLPPADRNFYTLLPQRDILSLLETENPAYIGAVAARKGCMNSALFTEEIAGYLLKTYADRFTIVEESPVHEVRLQKGQATIHINAHTVTAEHVVLCTNGFEKFKLTNEVGRDIDSRFHQLVRGSVGYMAAYLEEHDRSPIAISYLPQNKPAEKEAFDSDPYFYLTRRPFEDEQNQKYNLICAGGPEALMDDTNNYSKEHPYPDEAQNAIDTFLHSTYAHAPKGNIAYTYRWHGLMGYTPNGIRCIGTEALNPVLLYNLGCNGVGILPSIYGGKRISHILAGEIMEKSIFDPIAA